MPAVPYKGYGDVEPTSAAIPDVRISTPIEAFGGGVAQAIGHLGKTVEGAGDELWKRAVALQEVQNKAAAEEAETHYMQVAGDLHARYNSLQGKAAVDAYPAYRESLDNARVGIREGLGNDYTKRLYDSASRGIMGRHIFNGAGHAAAQNKVYIAGTSAANLASIQDYVMHNPQDESAYDDGVQRTIREINGTQRPLAGWGDEQTRDKTREAVSQMTTARIVGLAKTDPMGASAMAARYKDRLYGDDVEKVDRVITSQTRTIGSRIGAKEAGSLDLDVPLEEAFKKGEEWVTKNFPNDPAMPGAVRQHIIADRGQVKAAKREKDFDNSEIMGDAIVGLKSGGRRPASLEELIAADPRVEQIWPQLSSKEQGKYLEAFSHNAKDPFMLTPDRDKQYRILKGMGESRDDDEAREKFMYTNIPALELPDAQKKDLLRLQKSLRRNLDADPRIMKALQILAPMIHAARIEKKIDEDSYYQFRAGLQDAIDDFQKTHPGKAPTSKEYQELGSRLIQEVATTPSMFVPGSPLGRLFAGKTPMFRVPTPPEAAAKIQEAFFADKGRNPTEEETHRYYIMQQYQELYGAKPKAKPAIGE